MKNSQKYWLKFGIIFATISILLSMVAYNTPGIRYPHDNSDLGIYLFPNAVLGIPATIASRFFVSLFFPPKSLTGDEINAINLPITLFVSLTIYWFLIGSVIGWIYGNSKNRKVNVQ